MPNNLQKSVSNSRAVQGQHLQLKTISNIYIFPKSTLSEFFNGLTENVFIFSQYSVGKMFCLYSQFSFKG